MVLMLATTARASIPSYDWRNTPAPQGWSEVIANLQNYGVFTPENEPLPATIALADITGPQDASHHRDYVNIWGTENGPNKFKGDYLTVISEDWRIENGKWIVNQWLFRVSTEGQLLAAAKGSVVETLEYQVLESKQEVVSVNDPAVLTQFTKLIAKWRAFKPK
ncbi:MAG TPA: hypothetical protein DEB40_01090 [Elusimicrobia bacterium]|nr:hypothetical protein [Elusimicrobiota bacterium]HBT60325.1 hypothetical protein [Elusimicrobiota bacterium]